MRRNQRGVRRALAGRLVNGDDPADFERGSGLLLSPFGLLGGVAENFKLRLNKLQISTPLLLNLSVKGHKLPRLETVLQISGVKPDALQAASALAGSHLKNGHAAGAEQARGTDFGNDCGHLSRAKFGNPPRVYAVFVAKGR